MSNVDMSDTDDILSDLEMDDDFLEEMIETFLIEFEELMDLYKESLKTFRRIKGDKIQALDDIFRIYHTLKGDAAYFTEFEEFVKFSSNFCDRLRNPNEKMLKDQLLMRDIRLNYSRLSSAFSALSKGGSMRAFRFKIMLRNF